MMDSKGVSLYISHILGLALLLVAFGLITASMIGYYTNVSEQAQEAQALLVAQAMTEKVVELEVLYKDRGPTPTNSGSNITLAEVVMNVPAKISGKSYSIELLPRDDLWIINNISAGGVAKGTLDEKRSYSRVVIKTDGPPSITFSYDMYNVVAKTEGSARRTDAIKLSYVRTREGNATTDKVILSGT